METQKLYYQDPYLREFPATVLSCESAGEAWKVVLDQTAFYPEGGGQPADHGVLKTAGGEIAVTDVHEKNGAVVHTCAAPAEPGTVVTGVLDWARRFDHMQQHSGEHILSGILCRLYDCDNVGFHLGAEAVTIDYNADITWEQALEAERLANEAIWADRETEIFYPSPQELAALDYRGLVGAGRAIYIGDLEPDAGARISFDENDERELAGAVRLGGGAEVREAVGRLTEKVRRSGLAASQCNLFFLELLTCLLRLARGAGLEVEEVFGTGFTGAVQATDFSSFTAMGEWCLERCLRIQTLLRRQRTDSAGQTVERAKAYIREHYGESDLSVERLCDHLHLSPAYFSTLFKREMGMSFTAYVTVTRMEAAAEALRSSEDKTYLIARRCGYEDANYFSYVFKKHFGVTPTKFRNG